VKVLVADDDPVSRRLIEAALKTDGHEVIAAADGGQARDVVRHGDVDLAVLDWLMPETDGVELCREIRRRPAEGYLYVILLTTKGEQEDVVEGLDAGADDYLIKPFDPEELRARVRTGRRIVTLERRLLQANARLETLASTDELTGLMNRRATLARIEEEMGRSRREGRALTIMMMDVDRFKCINDEHGHAAGDAVLREFSRRVADCVRPYDAVGRLGGDEFLLLTSGASHQQVVSVGERVRSAVAGRPFQIQADIPLPVTASLGVADLRSTDGVEGILSRADEAMYEAKRRGGDRMWPEEPSGRPSAAAGAGKR
jgi:diguanylate cyclase (GGDEF)-like protein